jgi:hypothetical protein
VLHLKVQCLKSSCICKNTKQYARPIDIARAVEKARAFGKLDHKYTLLEKPSVTQDHNTRVTENSVTHIDREAQSLLLTDFSDRSTRMMEFSVTLVFCSCVTLGFFNSVLLSKLALF